MLSFKPIGSSSYEVSYYTQLGQEDYYVGGGEPPGTWWGMGADAIGLTGPVKPTEFRNVLKGLAPDGKRSLVQNAGHPKRRSAFDLTWSVPKSVSVAWSQANFQVRVEIEAAGERALMRVLDVVQEYCGVSRRGHRGSHLETAGLAAAVFRHDTARGVSGAAPDPNLHWRTVLLNLSTREDGSTGALDARSLFQPHMKMALGALFRAELAKELNSLGLSCHRPMRNGREASWFELDAVPAGMVEAFSKRREEITQWLHERGLSGAKAAEKATNATKKTKANWTRDELLKAWQDAGRDLGYNATALYGNKVLRAPTMRIADVEAIAKRMTQTESHFSKVEFIRRVAEQYQATGVGIDAIQMTVEEAINAGNEIVPLPDRAGEKRLTTREVLAVEARLLASIERARGSHRGIQFSRLGIVLKSNQSLRSEQRNAVTYITTSGDQIVNVNGMAGTGKTFMLHVARQAWEASNRRVLGTTLAAKAAEGLEEGAGIKSIHIHRLLMLLENGKEKLDADTVLVVDEAGMIGTVMMERLVSLTQQADAKLVLVGDYRQLQAIDAGGPFRAICRQLGAVELNEITRQRESWAREAVMELAMGDADSALARFKSRGLLTISKDRNQAMQALVRDWHQSGTSADSLIFAGTRMETTILNRLCQAKRLEHGELGKKRLEVGRESLHVGDRVVFTRNNASLLIRNGNTGTVIGICEETRQIRVELKNGYRLAVCLDTFDDLNLGYAVTTHKGQGQTVESAFVLAGDAMTDRELSYVQGSRSRGETRIYTDEIAAGDRLEILSRKMRKSRAKDLAHEYSIEAV